MHYIKQVMNICQNFYLYENCGYLGIEVAYNRLRLWGIVVSPSQCDHVRLPTAWHDTYQVVSLPGSSPGISHTMVLDILILENTFKGLILDMNETHWWRQISDN